MSATEQEFLIGIDIGSSHIKCIACDAFSDEGPKILATAEYPSHGIEHGYVLHKDRAQESLKKAIMAFGERIGQPIQQALVAVNGVGLSCHYVKTNLIKKSPTEITFRDTQDLLEKAEILFSEKYQNRKILHLVPLSYRVDDRDVLGDPIGMIGTEIYIKINLITIPEHHAESIMDLCEASGIQVLNLVASPVADGQTSLSYQQKKRGVVLVNLGAETTHISTYERGQLTSLKVINIGSGDITNDLALGLQIPLEQAESMKRKKTTSMSDEKVKTIIEARVKDVLEAIENHLKSIHKNRLLPAGVIWTGKASRLSGIHQMTKDSLKIPSRGVDLKHVVRQGRGTVFDDRYTVAYGLCALDHQLSQNNTSFSWKRVKENIMYWLKQLRP